MRQIMQRVPKRFYVGLLAGAMIASYGWIGESDYEQQLANTAMYCEMSDEGLWPVRPDLNCPVAPLLPGDRLVSM